VSPRAVELQEILKNIVTKMAPTEEEKQIIADLPGLIVEADSLAQDTIGVAIEDIPRQSIQFMHEGWLRHKAKVDSWGSAMRGRTKDLEGYRDELREQDAIWTVTLEAAVADSAPEVLMERIEATLAEIAAGEKAASDRMGEVIDLQSRLSDQEILLSGALAWVDVRRGKVEAHLFQREAEPIWKARDDLDSTLAERARKTWDHHVDAIEGYVGRRPAGFAAQIAVFVLLAVFIAILRYRSKRLVADDPSLGQAVLVLSRPVSASALLVLLFTEYFHAAAPVIFMDLMETLTVVPLLVMLLTLTDKRFRSAILATGILYILHKFYGVTTKESLLARFVLLLVSTGGVVVFIRVLWAARNNEPGLANRAVLAVVRTALFLFSIAFLANVWGSVRLAELLTMGTYDSLWGGALLVLVVLVLSGITTLSMKSRALQVSRVVRMHADVVGGRIIRVFRLAGILVWASYTLRVFSVRSDLGIGLRAIFNTSLKLGALEISIGAILTFFLTIYASFLISRLVRFTLEEEVLPRVALARGVAGAMTKILHYLIVTTGFFIALTAAGFDLGRVTIVAGALSVGIGFGLQTVVNNFVSGLILLIERPIEAGDTIELGMLKGQVRRIGIRSSIIKTFEGAEVIVPNADLISREVTNWTMSDRNRRVEIKVGVAYGSDPNMVMYILKDIAKNSEDVLEYPEPMILFLGFGESSLDFSLRAWTGRFDGWLALSSELTLEIHNALYDAGIEIPFPQRDLHVKSIDERASAALAGVKKATQNRRPKRRTNRKRPLGKRKKRRDQNLEERPSATRVHPTTIISRSTLQLRLPRQRPAEHDIPCHSRNKRRDKNSNLHIFEYAGVFKGKFAYKDRHCKADTGKTTCSPQLLPRYARWQSPAPASNRKQAGQRNTNLFAREEPEDDTEACRGSE